MSKNNVWHTSWDPQLVLLEGEMTQRGCLWWEEEEETGEEEVLFEGDESEVLITFRLRAEDIISMGSISRGKREALGGSPSVCLKSRM